MKTRPTTFVALFGLLFTFNGATQANHLVEICHSGDDMENVVLRVGARAAAAHLGHGDHEVGVEVTGDGIDNDCDASTPDTTSCPCWDAREVLDNVDATRAAVSIDGEVCADEPLNSLLFLFYEAGTAYSAVADDIPDSLNCRHGGPEVGIPTEGASGLSEAEFADCQSDLVTACIVAGIEFE